MISPVHFRRFFLAFLAIFSFTWLALVVFPWMALGHLQPVLVGAGEKKHILAVEPLKTRQRIGRDRLIGVANVRQTVGVRDSGRDIERRFRLALWKQGFGVARSFPFCGGNVCAFAGR